MRWGPPPSESGAEVALIDPDDVGVERPPPEPEPTPANRRGPTILFALLGLAAAVGGFLMFRPQEVTSTPAATTQPYEQSVEVTEIPDLSLFLGNRTELLRIDLTTGRTTAFDTAGWPVHAAAGWLVLIHPDGKSVRAVPLDDVVAEGELLGSSALASGGFGPGPEPSQIWLPTSEGATIWRFIEINSGQADDARGLPDLGVGTMSGRPVVTTSPDGGIFTLVLSEYRKIADGEPIALSREDLLTRMCSAEGVCQLRWLERDTWVEIERPTPDDDLQCGAWISPDSRWLAYVDVGDQVADDLVEGELRIFDVDAGEQFELSDGPVRIRCNLGAAVSRFGQHDLGSGRFSTPSDPLVLDSQALFVDRRDGGQ